MAYFDYSPVQVQPSGLSRILDGIDSGLDGARARRRQKEQDELARRKAERDDANQRAKQAYEEQLGRAQIASGQRAESRQAMADQLAMSDRRKATVMDIGRAQGAGGFGMARGIAAASQFPDPTRPGQLAGVGYEPIPGAPDPGAAPTADEGADLGMDSLESKLSDHQTATDAYQKSQKDPRFKMTFPGADPVEISGREQQQAAETERKQKAQNLLQSMPPNTPPEVLRAVAIQAGLIGAGTSNADNAPITNANAAVQAQGGRMDLAGVNNAAALERTKASRVGKGLGAGGGKYVSELVTMKENGEPDSAIATRAEALGLRPKDYLPSLANVMKTRAADKKAPGSTMGDVHGPGGAVIGNISTGDPALDRKRAEEVSKANTVYTDLQATLAQLDKSVKEEGFSMPSIGGVQLGDVASKREALHSHALIQLKEMAKLGVLAGPDMAIMEQQLGRSSANAAGFGGEKLGELQKIADRGHEKFLDSVGLNGKQMIPLLRGEGAAASPKTAPAHAVPKGETRKGPDGKMYRKVGPNNWQPI